MIWEGEKYKGFLHNHVRRNGRRYRKRVASSDSRAKTIERVGFDNRLKETEERKTFGHLEVNTFISRSSQGATITKKMSVFLMCYRCESGK